MNLRVNHKIHKLPGSNIRNRNLQRHDKVHSSCCGADLGKAADILIFTEGDELIPI